MNQQMHGILSILCFAASAVMAKEKPNIVLIADDDHYAAP